jgi:hypothetical protein
VVVWLHEVRTYRPIQGSASTDDVSLTGGPKAAFGGAVGCAILLGVFEGIGVLMGRMFAQPIPQLPRTCDVFVSMNCKLSRSTVWPIVVPEAAPPAVTA